MYDSLDRRMHFGRIGKAGGAILAAFIIGFLQIIAAHIQSISKWSWRSWRLCNYYSKGFRTLWWQKNWRKESRDSYQVISDRNE